MKRLFILVLMMASLVVSAQNNESNRGFIHPGGLHTQADFDRVKAQLAAGNTKVTQAYNILKQSEYSQSGVQTWPTETIVRGGGNGENYMNAARGAAMAYQNALRWKIDGTTDNADAAVRILMQWANVTKWISGDSNYALAAGIYGYQFAQAAELMRDYEGWSREDFHRFQQWMLSVWYPSSIGFLRGRNGTWVNSGKWWQAPGHYWSNWGLCNALCVISIGLLCDDVFIYNQGMSYYKYDQVGTFQHPRSGETIYSDGLTEFMGNLVVTTSDSELETGAYGQMGQMQESGRDSGHPAFALGLAADIAKVGWNQGDDLFAYMDHRLAAGIEYIAAQTQSIEGLPWTNYHYYTNGYFWTDSRSWLMTGPVLGVAVRPYWGTIIGIYEGVKGVSMPFAEQAYAIMGIDGGGAGGTSGGYDHLGYSVLMNTYNTQLAPAANVPTELSPRMQYSGSWDALVPSLGVESSLGNVSGNTILHNELGGLINNYNINNRTCVPRGQTLRLMPQLPEGEEDTGLWRWNTGETTREITVATNRSYVYRVTYTNANGVESQLCFPIAVEGDALPDVLTPYITYQGTTIQDTTITVLHGSTVSLEAVANRGWGTYLWSSGETTGAITTSPITSNTTLTANFWNQSATLSAVSFHVNVGYFEPYLIVDGSTIQDTTAIVAEGSTVVLGLRVPSIVAESSIRWSNGQTGSSISFTSPGEENTYQVSFQLNGQTYSQTFQLKYVYDENIEGTYYLYNPSSGRFLSAGDSWGTKTILDETGVDLIITASGNGYTLDSRINNSGANEFLGNDLYLDNRAFDWLIKVTGTANGKNTYTLTVDGVNYLAAPVTGNIITTTADGDDERAQWVFLSRDDLLQRMAHATTSNPVNATFLLPGYNFGRNDLRNNEWNGGPVINGDNTNMNGEKYNTTFDVYQTLTNIPNGIYEISLQAFYRDGNYDEAAALRQNGTEVINAYLYAQNESIPLPSIFDEAGNHGTTGVNTVFGYVPDSQPQASAYLSSGLYNTKKLRVRVSDGTLRLGIRKDVAVARDWTLFDNFHLTYYGNTLFGDVTNDGKLDNADVRALAEILLGKDNALPHRYNHDVADVNNDGRLTLGDITALVRQIRR